MGKRREDGTIAKKVTVGEGTWKGRGTSTESHRFALLPLLGPWYDPGKEPAMIELTEQQVQALKRPEVVPLRLVHPPTQQRFVLLSEEEYERLTGYDTGPRTDLERDLLRAEAVEALGWEDMEAYQDDQPWKSSDDTMKAAEHLCQSGGPDDRPPYPSRD
jgi:hypothetical protein